MDYTFRWNSPLGSITLASDGEALTGLWFDGQRHYAETLDPEHRERHLPVFDAACRWLEIYFSGRDPGFTPALALRTTPFRRQVWEIMLGIPYGSTMTYGAIADRVALARGLARMSSRAVGAAVGHNAISLIIPCHRVVGASGRLTGYAAGLARKACLLELEQTGVAAGRQS
ncbi:MAG: methylated-DNA--[Desulfovibrio sp.]|nr:methylated-DNA--[protein]-cysteine S-methyltransferase [Desulfovibrio sp.]